MLYHAASAERKYIVDITGNLPTILLEIEPAEDPADSSLKKTYIYADRQIIAQHDGGRTAAKYFYLHDRLGSVRLVIDDDGDVQNTYTYEPFGEMLATEVTETTENPFKFTGQYFDSEIDEYYLRARQYNPKIARFTARDPVGGKSYEPMTLHRYLYCKNNAINRVDLTGRMPSFTQIAVGVGVGAVIYAVAVHHEAIFRWGDLKFIGLKSNRASTADLRRFRDRLASGIPLIDAVRQDANLTLKNMEEKLREKGLGYAGQLGDGFLFAPGEHDFTEGEEYLTDLFEDIGMNVKHSDLVPGMSMGKDAATDLQTEIWRTEAIIDLVDEEIARRDDGLE